MADEMVHVFSNAVKETLRIWPALTLARQHGYGGSALGIKENWLGDSIVQIFKDNGKILLYSIKSILHFLFFFDVFYAFSSSWRHMITFLLSTQR